MYKKSLSEKKYNIGMLLPAKQRCQHSQMRISLITPKYQDFHHRLSAIKIPWLQETEMVDWHTKKLQSWVFITYPIHYL